MKIIEVIFLVVLLFLGIFMISSSNDLIGDGGQYASVKANLTTYTITAYDVFAVVLVLAVGAVLFTFLKGWNSGNPQF